MQLKLNGWIQTVAILMQQKGGKWKWWKKVARRCLLIYSLRKGLIWLEQSIKSSGALTADSAGELHVLGHDGDTLGVDSAQVGVLEEADHVGLGGLLESEAGWWVRVPSE